MHGLIEKLRVLGLFKADYLAIDAAAKKWTMSIRNWKGALNHFMIEFPERMPETL